VEKHRLLILSIVLFASGLPFALRLVPPNDIFSLHVHWSLKDPDVWLRAHAFAGWVLVAAGVAGITIMRLRPEVAENFGTVIGVALAMGAIFTTFAYLALTAV